MGRGGGEQFAFIGRADVGAGGQHGDDGVGPGRRFDRAGGARAAMAFGAGEGVGAEIEGAHGVSGFGQIGGHAAAHVADPDKGDCGHVGVLKATMKMNKFNEVHPDARDCRLRSGDLVESQLENGFSARRLITYPVHKVKPPSLVLSSRA